MHTCHVTVPEGMVVVGTGVGVVDMQRATGRGQAGHGNPFACIEVPFPHAHRRPARSVLVVPVTAIHSCLGM